uniref:Transmembrane protein 230 n=1 Tax=Sus scrofa TaxID=9823 RepID=A0A8D1AQZ7_PIG
MMLSRTNLTTGIPSSKVKYSRFSSTDDGYTDLQFKKSPPTIPYKAIALATVLFLISAFLIIIGSLLLAGYISKGGADRSVPVLIIGIWGRIGAVATGLHQSHSNAGSEPRLQPTPQLTATPDR